MRPKELAAAKEGAAALGAVRKSSASVLHPFSPSMRTPESMTGGAG